MSTVIWPKDGALRDAYERCVRTHTGVNPCTAPEYLEARYAYHQLLVKAGKLDPELADPKPGTGVARPGANRLRGR
jgi:hypothetical protein